MSSSSSSSNRFNIEQTKNGTNQTKYNKNSVFVEKKQQHNKAKRLFVPVARVIQMKRKKSRQIFLCGTYENTEQKQKQK